MSTIELKSSLHKIVDKIDNEQLLQTIYDFLKLSENSQEGQIWKTLTWGTKEGGLSVLPGIGRRQESCFLGRSQ